MRFPDRTRCAFGLALLFFACGSKVKRDLPTGMFKLEGLELTLPTKDLAPLDGIIGDAQVVALGESIHFSKAYHQARSRLIHYLIEQKGFRAISFEGPWHAAETTRLYVENKEGTLKNALSHQFFSAWYGQEDGELLQWLAAWNVAHPDDKVRFWGFDIQDPRDDGLQLSQYLAANDLDALLEPLKKCIGVGDSNDELAELLPKLCDGTATVSEEDNTSCLGALDQLDAYSVAHPTSAGPTADAETVPLARIASRAVRASHGMFRQCSDYVASSNARDAGMADVFMAMRELRAPGVKTIIWAHNLHIAHKLESIEADFAWKNMGSHLRDKIGDDYVAIGLVARAVFSNWGFTDTQQMDFSSSDHIEHELSSYQTSPLLVDTSAALPAGKSYRISEYKAVPAEQYRGLLFVENSPGLELWHE